jgi:hypothetical protein
MARIVVLGFESKESAEAARASDHGGMVRGSIALLAVAACCAVLAGPPAAQARTERTYIAIGDSVTGMPDSFAPRLYKYLRRKSHGGATRFIVVPSLFARTILEPGDALDRATRLIKGRSNVIAVTLTTGGNDALAGACWTGPTCPYPSNLDTILRGLNKALKRDPGRERLELLAYYNPVFGLGGRPGIPNAAAGDVGLLGSDLRIDCSGTGTQVGLNDDIACIGWRDGWVVVDAWPFFHTRGATLLAPGDVHPTSAGHALLARLFEKACRLPAAGPGVWDPDGFLAARPLNGGRGCTGVR